MTVLQWSEVAGKCGGYGSGMVPVLARHGEGIVLVLARYGAGTGPAWSRTVLSWGLQRADMGQP